MVLIGRIVALVSLIVATSVAPTLKSLDQAYQYIQEYTGYIYPGSFLIFFCGLFWRQASANAAFWVALITIPLGIVFKVTNPEMPFILRIGYVFIILSIVMIGLSLLDKSGRVENPVHAGLAKRAIRSGWMLVGGSMLVGLVVSFFVVPMRNLALEAIYVLVVGFILIGAITLLNSTRRTMNRNGIIVDKQVFRTTPAFTIAAIGICGILAMLYSFFW
jgi:SSS family solute:Na+ symporter